MTQASPGRGLDLDLQIVVYRNDEHDIERCVRSVGVAARLAADNGVVGSWSLSIGDCSGDDRGAWAGGLAPEVERFGGVFHYQDFGANLGHGGGHNRLAAVGGGSAICIVNPDAVLDPSAVSELVSGLPQRAGMADGRQIPLEHPKSYDAVTGLTEWASGAFAVVRREAFEEVGGFDSATFFLYADDVDLSWRLRRAGWSIHHVPSARVFHDKRLTTTADYVPGPAESYYSAEASLLLAHKYSRPDVVESELRRFAARGVEKELEACASFRARREPGDLPAPIDPDHTVGRFRDGLYADHRF